eukprot:GDKJ01055853.1.p1 GENE.GDKJ01055853.1~~GDKJ01055853.1.p1  ORF type:complete len:430 (-),score=83.06 GDKJ01055853.1:136-1398(-)
MYNVLGSSSPNGKQVNFAAAHGKRRIMKEFLHISMSLSKPEADEKNNPNSFPKLLEVGLHHDNIIEWNLKYALSPVNEIFFRVRFPDDYPLQKPAIFMICNSSLELSIVESFVQTFTTAYSIASHIDQASECYSPPAIRINELTLEVEVTNLLLSSSLPAASFATPLNNLDLQCQYICYKIMTGVMPKLTSNNHLPPSIRFPCLFSDCPTPVPSPPSISRFSSILTPSSATCSQNEHFSYAANHRITNLNQQNNAEQLTSASSFHFSNRFLLPQRQNFSTSAVNQHHNYDNVPFSTQYQQQTQHLESASNQTNDSTFLSPNILVGNNPLPNVISSEDSADSARVNHGGMNVVGMNVSPSRRVLKRRLAPGVSPIRAISLLDNQQQGEGGGNSWIVQEDSDMVDDDTSTNWGSSQKRRVMF